MRRPGHRPFEPGFEQIAHRSVNADGPRTPALRFGDPRVQATHDLRRLRLAGLIRRIEHTSRCVLIPEGTCAVSFYTNLRNRLLRPLLTADQPQATPELRHALRTIGQHPRTASPAHASARAA
jgi:hypothetical protein